MIKWLMLFNFFLFCLICFVFRFLLFHVIVVVYYGTIMINREVLGTVVFIEIDFFFPKTHATSKCSLSCSLLHDGILRR